MSETKVVPDIQEINNLIRDKITMKDEDGEYARTLLSGVMFSVGMLMSLAEDDELQPHVAEFLIDAFVKGINRGLTVTGRKPRAGSALVFKGGKSRHGNDRRSSHERPIS